MPLSGPEYSPGKRVDVWAQVVTFTEIAALVAAVEMIVTIFKMRAPGMSLNRIPLYVWSILVVSFMIVFAMPSVAIASTMMLAMDRLVATHFFNRAEGGDPLLWQHLFWFFGHPEVYIMFIPGLGFVSSIVETFTQRQIFGYPVMVLSLFVTGFVAFGLWVHHMFATPIPQLGRTLFTAASVLIAVPTRRADLLLDRDDLGGTSALHDGDAVRASASSSCSRSAALTGVMIASVPFDLQVHDTYFIVAHFHYVILGGVVFPLFGACYCWFPKITGRMLSETLGQVALLAVLRRRERHLLPDAPARARWDAAARVHLSPRDGLGEAQPARDARRGGHRRERRGVPRQRREERASPACVAGDDPWGASGLEWATTLAAARVELPSAARRGRAARRCGSRATSCPSPPGSRPTGARCSSRPRSTPCPTTGTSIPASRTGRSSWRSPIGVTFIGAVWTPWAYVDRLRHQRRRLRRLGVAARHEAGGSGRTGPPAARRRPR